MYRTLTAVRGVNAAIANVGRSGIFGTEGQNRREPDSCLEVSARLELHGRGGRRKDHSEQKQAAQGSMEREVSNHSSSDQRHPAQNHRPLRTHWEV